MKKRKETTNHAIADLKLSSFSIALLILSTHDDWSLGNEKRRSIHGKEEVTKQQNRKEKTATSVRELHKLQEIARPSDAKLFYAEVEKEIETATVATLEGFVVMKTKPIHNSVKQWADRAVLGVKALIG